MKKSKFRELHNKKVEENKEEVVVAEETAEEFAENYAKKTRKKREVKND